MYLYTRKTKINDEVAVKLQLKLKVLKNILTVGLDLFWPFLLSLYWKNLPRVQRR